MDCGRVLPFYCYDFDHLDGETKKFMISAVGWGTVGLTRLKEEVAKCDLVCAVCHRIRTYNRQNGIPLDIAQVDRAQLSES